MGSGIAVAFLQSGYAVRMIERDEGAAARARELVEQRYRRARERGAEVPPVPRLMVCTTAPDVAPALIIESVFESYHAKAEVLASMANSYPDAVLATNTSSLSIDVLARSVPTPDRLIGMHFFNPVPSSALIEIVRGAATSDVTVEQIERHTAALGKTPIVVRDAPGFATSRLGIALGLEAMRMVQEGVASCRDIDLGMELGYRHPMGPLELSDMVGLDVRLHIADHLARELGPRFSAPNILRDKVERGEVGVKAGAGFYRWDGRTRLGPA